MYKACTKQTINGSADNTNHNTIDSTDTIPVYRSALPDWDIAGKWVILRADLNIEFKTEAEATQNSNTENNIIDDFRLRALLPTIDLILQKQGNIILITHIGRPHGPTESLSTQRLIPWFKQHNYTIIYAASPADAYNMIHKHKNQTDFNNSKTLHHSTSQNNSNYSASPRIILLENIRFFPGEKNKDPLFAEKLARLGDFYINDGFGVMHRSDASVVQLPALFRADRCTFGLLVARELNELTPLIKNPQKPFVLIIGGAKIAEKITLIEHMLATADFILLCPALVFTFNKALNKPVGASLVDDTSIPLCLEIIGKARKKSVTIVYPRDYQVATESLEGPLSITTTDIIEKNKIGISVGPKTINAFKQIIQTAGTIFVNGLMGFTNKPATLSSAYALLDLLAKARGKTIVAGGDSVAAVYMHGVEHQIDYLSTGGGAALSYMSGQQLPGLEILLKKRAEAQ